MIKKIIAKLKSKNDLTYQEISQVMFEILSGHTSDHENLEFLTYLTEKGETDEELCGMLDKMQEFSIKIIPKNQKTIIDMCGTGGDKLQTFNISTAASFVVASAGAAVAKHGNRSHTGVTGSADIFEFFGYDLNQDPMKISTMLQKYDICFMFAPKFHPAMKNIAQARKQIAKKTVFNLLGPLTNPANVKNQLIGVFSIDYLERLPRILEKKGSKNIMTVRSSDGLDEFSTSSTNRICMLRNNKIISNVIDPQILGLHKSSLKQLQIKDKNEAIRSFLSVLNNSANQAMIETTALNAAAGLIVGNVVNDFEEGVQLALDTITKRKPFKLFEKLIQDYGNPSKIAEVKLK